MHHTHRSEWPGEAQRRDERRTEARLAQGLQRLDEAKHYHLNALTQEQRALHQHLIAIKTGNRRRGFHVMGSRPTNHDFSHPAPSFKRALLPTIPLADKKQGRHRSTKVHSSSLQARIQEFISSGENRAKNSTAPLFLPDLKLWPANPLPPVTSETEESKEKERDEAWERGWGRQRSVQEMKRDKHEDTQRENEMTAVREKDRENTEETSQSPLLESLAPDGRLRTVHTLPSFAQALAEARKARYIRHRGQPLCERELSIKEIFCRNSKVTHTTR